MPFDDRSAAWVRRLRSLDVLECIHLAMLAALGAVTGWWWSVVPAHATLLTVYAALAVLLLVAPAIRVPGMDFPHRFKQVYPFLYIAIVFDSLGSLLPHVNPHSVDEFLLDIDVTLAGVAPTHALESFVSPWAVELVTLVYASYFVLPFVLIALLVRHDRRDLVKRWAVVVTVALYSNYLLYLVFPARGPHLHMAHTVPLQGLWSAAWLRRTFDTLESNKFDVFPSAHVAVGLVTLYGFARYLRRHAAVVTVLVIGICFSTVYLRYHYVVDVLAGLALAAVSIPVAEAACTRFARSEGT